MIPDIYQESNWPSITVFPELCWHWPVILRVERTLKKFHVAGQCFFHDGVANRTEVGQVAGRPQKDHLQTLKDQQQLDTTDVRLEQYRMNFTITYNTAFFQHLIMCWSYKQLEKSTKITAAKKQQQKV